MQLSGTNRYLKVWGRIFIVVYLVQFETSKIDDGSKKAYILRWRRWEIFPLFLCVSFFFFASLNIKTRWLLEMKLVRSWMKKHWGEIGWVGFYWLNDDSQGWDGREFGRSELDGRPIAVEGTENEIRERNASGIKHLETSAALQEAVGCGLRMSGFGFMDGGTNQTEQERGDIGIKRWFG